MTVIQFPVDRPPRATDLSEPAVILTLPVIRIERYDDDLAANHFALVGIVGKAAEARARRAINRLREAVKALPRALDERGEPV